MGELEVFETKSTLHLLKWQGETPEKILFIECYPEFNIEQPLYWSNYDVVHGDSVIPGLLVSIHNQTFIICNRFGEGYKKMMLGGWPNFGHASFPSDVRYEVVNPPEEVKWNPDARELHLTKKEEWQEKAFPEQFKEIKALKDNFWGIRKGIPGSQNIELNRLELRLQVAIGFITDLCSHIKTEDPKLQGLIDSALTFVDPSKGNETSKHPRKST